MLLADPGGGTLVGRIVGRFRLVRLLGEGGTSRVYLGERTDDFKQTAAVKLLRQGLEDPERLWRFHTEQQALAALKHPNIVQLIDGGITEDGIPYLAMDYIEGAPVDQFCDMQRLPFRERIGLMIQVLEAVEYAHQRFLAHCDLKCSNILVSADRKPHLLDFGVIKPLGPLKSGRETPSQASQQPFSTPFASPEQQRGQNLTTATDLYSAGVVLYTLLTGTRIFEFVRDQLPASRHTDLSEEAEPPSHRLKRLNQADPATARRVAAARATTPARLWRELRGDMDSILVKALHNEPERRYHSAAQFAADLENFLEARPVESRRGSARYRAGKFIERNRAGALAAGLLILALVAGVAGVCWQAIHAQRSRATAEVRFREARALTLSLMVDFLGEVQKLEGSEKVQELLVQRARQQMDNLARQCEGNPAILIDLAGAYLHLGNLQAADNHPNPDRGRDSLASFDRGLALVDMALRQENDNRQALLTKTHLLSARSRVRETRGNLHESARDSRLATEPARKPSTH